MITKISESEAKELIQDRDPDEATGEGDMFKQCLWHISDKETVEYAVDYLLDENDEEMSFETWNLIN